MDDCVKFYEVKLPTKVAFHHSAATRTFSESVILSIRYGGFTGYGEAAPRMYVSGDTTGTVLGELATWFETNREFLNVLLSESLVNHEALSQRLTGLSNSAICAVELSLKDLQEKMNGVNDCSDIDDKLISFVPVCDGAGRWSVDSGVIESASIIKMKVGKDIKAKIPSIKKVRERTKAEILVDVNNGWYRSDAVNNASILIDAGVTWFEEPGPVQDWHLFSSIRDIGGRILLDESFTGQKDLQEAISLSAVDGVNLRISKNGGIQRTKELTQICRGFGLERYYGVHVAEVGTLIPAQRMVAALDKQRLGVESGQADLLFDEKDLWSTVLPPDRHSLRFRVPHMLSGRKGSST